MPFFILRSPSFVLLNVMVNFYLVLKFIQIESFRIYDFVFDLFNSILCLLYVYVLHHFHCYLVWFSIFEWIYISRLKFSQHKINSCIFLIFSTIHVFYLLWNFKKVESYSIYSFVSGFFSPQNNVVRIYLWCCVY